MSKRHYYCIIDTETTQSELVADFAAIIVDRRGKIYAECAVLVNGIFTDPVRHPLFFSSSAPPDSVWSSAGKDKRYSVYSDMVANGTRMVASVSAINRWLERARGEYNPVLTAYNLAFDVNKCLNTGIDLGIFSQSFCLWYAAVGKFASGRKFRKFVLENHAFNAPTGLGNMTYRTDAELMARFVLGDPSLPAEPHTAREDAVFYELPILTALTKRMSLQEIIKTSRSYDWRMFQVRDHFTPV